MRFSAVFLLLLTSLSAQDSEGRRWLNQGVQAFKSARYPEAVIAFQKAVDLSPEEVTPRLYLATAYMQQHIPGLEREENVHLAEQAEAAFQKVLDLEPQNVMALESLASLALNRKKWDDATNWYRRVLNAKPDHQQAYYSLGLIAWSRWYPAYMEARTRLRMRQEEPGPLPNAEVRTSMRAQWWGVIDEGIWNLNRALEIDPRYDDAMAYMNLMIRERADLRDTLEEYRQDILVADQWVTKALETKKAKAAGGSQIRSTLIAPPPPPPPPPPAGSPGAKVGVVFGGNIQAATLVQKIDPVYPPLAVQARIQGVVQMEAVISTEGKVKNVRMLGGHPLLVPAALDAVKQWVYQPTILNGSPVELQIRIDVPFVLPN